MAKGQKNAGREAKKPKSAVKKVVVAPSAFSEPRPLPKKKAPVASGS